MAGAAGDKYSTTSSSSLVIANSGTAAITVGSNLNYSVGQSIVAANTASNIQYGNVTGYNPITGALSFTQTGSLGSGTYTSWTVNLDGAVGVQGATGPSGATGIQGASGSTGLTGATGPSGASGATGSAGINGSSGATGPSGSNGTNGASGATGSAGTNGASGATGPSGSGLSVTNDIVTNASYYPAMYSVSTGIPAAVYTSSTQLYFNPSTGTLNSTIYNSLSDKKKKKNIKKIKNAVDTVNQLNGVEFQWKESGAKSYGVIAQELEEVIPDLVSTDNNGNKSVNYNGLFGFLINAIKEQQKQIDELKKKNK